MSITSLTFVLFALLTLIVYYIAPKKFQWCVLLLASGVFYLSGGVKNILYVLVTATTIYAATRLMQGVTDRQKAYLKENKESLTKEEKTAYKDKNKARRKAIMIVTLLINIGILCVFKYFHFALEQVNAVAAWFGSQGILDTFGLIAPLGISFYTFQSIGYLVDVYWEYYEPEKNYLKVLLFVSFFPQMTQGPISDFQVLSKELFSEHRFEYKNYSWGFQRLLWGFVKKIIIADTLSLYVNDVFQNYADYSGLAVLFGMFFYSVQIYADFSGYMDIMCGFCEMLGIKLTENFNRPYFSKSVAEYWRRWHISLGDWFKKYIYYPIGMSNWSRKLAKNSREKLGKHFADTMPASIALVVTWLATGLWHGASWAYIVWGLVNGLFIILSLWMEPVYAKCRTALKINESSWLWRAFQTIRTFILVTFIKVLPEVGTLKDGLGLWKSVFVNRIFHLSVYELIPLLEKNSIITLFSLGISLLCTVLLFIFSLIERKTQFRNSFNKIPVVVKTLIYTFTILFLCISNSNHAVGFLYENF